jgi:hypothetical protein
VEAAAILAGMTLEDKPNAKRTAEALAQLRAGAELGLPVLQWSYANALLQLNDVDEAVLLVSQGRRQRFASARVALARIHEDARFQRGDPELALKYRIAAGLRRGRGVDAQARGAFRPGPGARRPAGARGLALERGDVRRRARGSGHCRGLGEPGAGRRRHDRAGKSGCTGCWRRSPKTPRRGAGSP